jgi:hypothetical protein
MPDIWRPQGTFYIQAHSGTFLALFFTFVKIENNWNEGAFIQPNIMCYPVSRKFNKNGGAQGLTEIRRRQHFYSAHYQYLCAKWL